MFSWSVGHILKGLKYWKLENQDLPSHAVWFQHILIWLQDTQKFDQGFVCFHKYWDTMQKGLVSFEGKSAEFLRKDCRVSVQMLSAWAPLGGLQLGSPMNYHILWFLGVDTKTSKWRWSSAGGNVGFLTCPDEDEICSSGLVWATSPRAK